MSDDRRPRIYLHVGLHKTGTTYLQGLWRANRDPLADQQIHFPGGTGEPSQRMACYDLLGRRPGGPTDQRTIGQWPALVDTVNASPQPVVLLSEEGLSVATTKQVSACVQSFPTREVHLILTVRDLGRVLVSAWQEDIKNDRTWTWPEYAAAVADPQRRGQNPGRGFWRAQDLPHILATWASAVPAERIHLVTVPPPGSERGLLLRRMGEVVGFDADSLTGYPPVDNASLGTAGTEVVRRLNEGLGHRFNQRQHSQLVNHTIVPYLAGHATDAAFGLPEDQVLWVAAEGSKQVQAIRDLGCPVVGDLDDLAVRASSRRRPDDASDSEVLAVALLALQGVSERYVDLWWSRSEHDAPAVEPGSLRVRLASHRRNLGYRVKRYGAGLADRNRLAAKAMEVYLRRGRP